MAPYKDLRSRVTRRELLGMMGAAGVAAAVACDDDGGEGDATSTTDETAAAPTATTGVSGTPSPSALNCVVSPQMTEGPYFVDEQLNRSDVREDPSDGSVSEGTLLTLALRVYSVEGDSCVPVSGAHVDIWHCNAEGLYSDVEANGTVGQKFLRGYQLTDDAGACEFTTVYPGWYTGRAVHIHVKVRTDPDSEQGYEFTSQFFFDDALTEQVFAEAPYADRGSPDTTNATDNIYQTGGDQMLLNLSPEGDGYAVSFSVGMQIT
jgi:protocatechuate 3,4-dioxygenase beta subunit